MIAKWIILSLFLPLCLFGEGTSYYQGYLFYKNYIEDLDLDFDQILEGMKAAHQGIEISREEIKKKQNELYEEMKEAKLHEANLFFEKLARDEITELVKGKLYYKTINAGLGENQVKETDSPYILYTAKFLVKGKEEETYNIETPTPIRLQSAISGFSQGVVGMREGEKRILYIHPDLAYGETSSKMGPNTLMIFDVEVVKIQP